MPQPRLLVDGLVFPESPRWHDGRLWLADWGAGEVLSLRPDGAPEVAVSFSSFPMCFDWLDDGRLLIVSATEGRIVRREPDGSLRTHAALRHLSVHPWNEIVVDGRNAIYVNNTGFDFPEGEYAPGIVAVVSPDGSTRRVADDVVFPNGMAVTPDNSTLIVAESFARRLSAFDIDADGGLSNRRVWADLGGGSPDGIALDADGAVWFSDVPNRRCVRVAEGGAVLQTVELDRGCFACALGGEDRPTLYLVANEWRGPQAMTGGAPMGQVLSIEAPAPRAADRDSSRPKQQPTETAADRNSSRPKQQPTETAADRDSSRPR